MDLDLLGVLLREAGLRVGAQESLRLDLVLQRLLPEVAPPAPAQMAPQAQALLGEHFAAVVVKAPGERALFDRVFAEWLARQAALLPEAPPLPAPAPPRSWWARQGATLLRLGRALRAARPWGPRVLVGHLRRGLRAAWRRLLRLPPMKRWLVAVVVLSALSGGVAWRLLRSSPPPGGASTQGAQGELQAGLVKPTAAVPTEDLARPGDSSATPRLLEQSLGGPRIFWPSLALVGLAALGGLALFLLLRRRSYLPAALPWPAKGVPARRLLRGGHAALLLDRRDEDGLVYGVGHFVTDEPTRRLHVPASVRATAAAGGRAVLRFVQRRAQREVWLWVDEAAASLDAGQAKLLSQLPTEMASVLGRAGLPVEQATFYGVPDRLEARHGAFAPAEVDERREAALVVVWTDGRILARCLADEGTRRTTQALLRTLAHWPRLWFVDVSRGVHGLGAALTPHGLAVIAPEDVVGVLAGDTRRRRRTGGEAETRAWAASLALAPFPVSEELAHAAGQHLALRIGPWDLERVRSHAEQVGGRMDFGGAARVELLGWLAAADPALLEAALEFWRGLLARAEQAEAEKTPPVSGVVGSQTWAVLHLRRDRALLDLWDRPALAARVLYQLHGGDGEDGPLREEIRTALAQHTPKEGAGKGCVVLPWRYAAQPATTRAMLQHMGFAGLETLAGVLRRPGRVHLGWGLCAGACLGGLLALRHVPTEPPQVVELGARPAGAQVRIERQGARQVGAGLLTGVVPWYQVAAQRPALPGAGGPGAVSERAEVAAGGAVTVAWLAPKRDCSYGEEREDKAGMVFVRVCAGAFTMGSAQDDKDASSDERPAHLVRLSEFWIGRQEVSNDEYRKWRPDHQKDERGDWPATNVNWEDARDYCTWLGGRLPTEAEWEYAARGSDGRRYPWGNEAPDAEHAISYYTRQDAQLQRDQVKAIRLHAAKEKARAELEELDGQLKRLQGLSGQALLRAAEIEMVRQKQLSVNAELEKVKYGDLHPVPVGSLPKGRGPFGTLHQAGNVWEWVKDCLDRYQDGQAVDNPDIDRVSCPLRVLRGGSFLVEPQNLRAACRFGIKPANRGRDVGFRCVRTGHRQP